MVTTYKDTVQWNHLNCKQWRISYIFLSECKVKMMNVKDFSTVKVLIQKHILSSICMSNNKKISSDRIPLLSPCLTGKNSYQWFGAGKERLWTCTASRTE